MENSDYDIKAFLVQVQAASIVFSVKKAYY